MREFYKSSSFKNKNSFEFLISLKTLFVTIMCTHSRMRKSDSCGSISEKNCDKKVGKPSGKFYVSSMMGHKYYSRMMGFLKAQKSSEMETRRTNLRELFSSVWMLPLRYVPLWKSVFKVYDTY